MWMPDFFLTLTSKIKRLRPARRRRANAGSSCFESLEDRCLLSFTAGAANPVGNYPAAIATGDFNNDGRPDLVTANLTDNTVSVLLANAGGTFQPARNSATGVNPQSVAVGDFNGDGKLDLTTANLNDVSVLLGNGNGTFQAPSSLGVVSNPSSVAVGDFNNDGKLDLGVASNLYIPWRSGYYYWYPARYIGSSNILLGTGTGSFTLATAPGTGDGLQTSALIADFNNDGRKDFATVSPDMGGVSVLLGSSTGLPATVVVSASPPAGSAVAADVNNDGKVDLLMTNLSSSGLTVMLGNGTGSFTSTSYDINSFGGSLTAADFNGDGKIDVAGADAGNAVKILLGTGAGTFSSPVVAATGSTGSGAVAIVQGDFNSDGRRDVATVNSGSTNAFVLLNNGVWPSPGAPSITVNDVSVIEGNTGSRSATFTVRLSAASTQTVSVHYATADGTATLAGNDFQATSGTLTFAPGQTSLTISVPVNGDRLAESITDTFLVKLDDAVNAFVSDGMGICTIQDDEPLVQATPAELTEGNTGTRALTFMLQLSAAYDAPVTVTYATVDLTLEDQYGYWVSAATAGIDYTAATGTATFAPGVTSVPVTVQVLGDRLFEPQEYFFLKLTGSNSAYLSEKVLGSIIDDEPIVSFSNQPMVTEGNSGTKPMTFTISLSAASDVPVTVNYTTSDGEANAGVDYVATSGSVTFAPGQTSKSITVMIKGDRVGEPQEGFYIYLTGATNSGLPNYQYGAGVILDDEAQISVNDVSITEGNSGTKQMTVRVTLAAAYDQVVTVHYRTDDWTATAGEDYVSTSGTLTFAVGQTSKTFTITIKGDKKKEYDERIFISIDSASSNAMIANYAASGDIVDDDGRSGRGAKKLRARDQLGLKK